MFYKHMAPDTLFSIPYQNIKINYSVQKTEKLKIIIIIILKFWEIGLLNL